jgi:branched-chain amino acid aminotransferase
MQSSKMEKVFLNDGLVDADKASVSVSDGGFLYGAGLFETMRCNNGVVFCLDEHLDRLFASAEKLSVFNSYDKKYITDAVYSLLKANNLIDARIRLTLTSGTVSASEQERKSTLLIAATALQDYPVQYYEKGVMVVISPYRQNTAEAVCGHKTTSYFSRLLALQDAHRKGAAEAVWFTGGNLLAEGCISNVFLVRTSVIYTPLLSTPVLPGIASKTVCKIAVENGIELIEKDLSIDDLLGADEIFLTNVIMKVMPVIAVEKHTTGGGRVGPVAKRLIRLFDEFIKSQCG